MIICRVTEDVVISKLDCTTFYSYNNNYYNTIMVKICAVYLLYDLQTYNITIVFLHWKDGTRNNIKTDTKTLFSADQICLIASSECTVSAG